ncbi:MAG: guanylate kinase [bacterium]|nr:guanylate kinase [bacterium]MDE0669408.1 guanylate kinase [bacterium]
MSGPGGSGKSTLARLLVEQDDRLWLSRSWTTRSRRAGELDDAYCFVDPARFDAAVEADEFLEWAEFGSDRYGTPHPAPPPGCDILLEIDVQGARQVRRRHPEALLLFLEAPSDRDQAHRLRGRGDSEDHVRTRLSYGASERETARELGAVVVVNADLAETVAAMGRIIADHRERLAAAGSPSGPSAAPPYPGRASGGGGSGAAR